MKIQVSNLTKNNDLWKGFWRLADPKITLASMSSIFLGSCLVFADGELDIFWLLITVFAFFSIEVAKNASGDIYDYQTDISVKKEDRTDFSGGKRVLVDGLLSKNQTWVIALIFYVLGIGSGVIIVIFREPQALWIGLIGLILAWSYNGPPARLAYRGFGEIDVAVCYGPLICLSTYVIQLGEFSIQALLISIPLGLLIAAFLWVNEFPDYMADIKANKRNMIVRLGRQRASRILPLLQLSAFMVLMMLPFAGFSYNVLWGGVAIIPSALAAIYVWRDPEHAYRNFPVSAMALIAFLLMSLGCGIGILM